MTSLKKLALRGAFWTIAGYGTNQILRFGSNLILTRLLVPEFFGLMAVLNTIMLGIELLSDIGIGQSVINSKRGDEPLFLNTAWTIQVIRGFLLWLLCVLVAWPAANFYQDARLLSLIPVVGLISVIQGLGSTSLLSLQRQMDLGKYTLFELIIQILFLSTLIIWAKLNPSIWALALGGLLGGIYKAVASHFLIPGYSNRFAWDRDAVKEILSFGKWIFVATAMMFAAEQADRLILAKLLSFQLLGVYTIAYALASMPREVIKHLSYRVIFPTVSKQADLPRSSLRAKILRQRRLMLIGIAVFLAVLVGVGDLIISVLYDDRYIQATWMMPILCAGIWFSVLFYTVSPALLAVGKPFYSAHSNLARFIMIGVGLPLAFALRGIVGAIVVIALSDLPLYVVNLYGLWREKLSCIAQDIQTTALFIGVLALVLIIRHSLGLGLPIQAIL